MQTLNRLTALRSHRTVLQKKIGRLHDLINTVDTTIKHLEGEMDMSKKKLFQGFSEEKQKQYEREARLQWGPERVNESVQRWGSYSKQKQEAIMEEGGQNYLALTEAMEAGKSPHDEDVQKIIKRWHDHLHYFYEPTLDLLRGLGELYTTHPEFMAFFHQFHDDLPDYLNEAIIQYVDDLEHAEIVRMLAEDDEGQVNG